MDFYKKEIETATLQAALEEYYLQNPSFSLERVPGR